MLGESLFAVSRSAGSTTEGAPDVQSRLNSKDGDRPRDWRLKPLADVVPRMNSDLEIDNHLQPWTTSIVKALQALFHCDNNLALHSEAVQTSHTGRTDIS